MMLEEVASGLARVYFIGVAQAFRNVGLSVYMLILGTEIVQRKGIDIISCAWMLESNIAVTGLVKKFLPSEAIQERRYRILSLNN
jgi:hypothetical protein